MAKLSQERACNSSDPDLQGEGRGRRKLVKIMSSAPMMSLNMKDFYGRQG